MHVYLSFLRLSEIGWRFFEDRLFSELFIAIPLKCTILLTTIDFGHAVQY